MFYLTVNESSNDLAFDAMTLKDYAKLQLSADNRQKTLNIRKVNGDGTGLIRMQSNHKGTLERYRYGNLTHSKLDINLELHNGGEFILSETVTVLGLAPTALDLNGVLRGVINMVVGPSRHARIGKDAQIVPFQATDMSTQAKVTFGTLQLDPGSSVDYDPNTGAEMVVGEISLKFASALRADYVNLSCSNLDLELEAVLSSAAADRQSSDTIDVTVGSVSCTSGATTCTGAGHGGQGGSGTGGSSTGRHYGSLYRPNRPGSKANPTGGGRGGGKMYLKVGGTLINDGDISVNGSASSYGGGSGGSILIETYFIDGYGTISSVGGAGKGKGTEHARLPLVDGLFGKVGLIDLYLVLCIVIRLL